ncbi:MAG: PIN domain-containing protein [Chloroflexota bacterium]
MISGEQPLLTLIRRYRQAGILVDANVLILLFIGILDRSYIERFERTKSYTPEDFGALVQILQYFQRIIVTPHILTEVSNFVGRMHHDRRYAYFQVVRSLLITTPGQFIVDEQYRPAKLIVLEPEFYRLGLTDAGIIHKAMQRHCLVLTDDGPLAEQLARRGLAVLNFGIIRASYRPQP